MYRPEKPLIQEKKRPKLLSKSFLVGLASSVVFHFGSPATAQINPETYYDLDRSPREEYFDSEVRSQKLPFQDVVDEMPYFSYGVQKFRQTYGRSPQTLGDYKQVFYTQLYQAGLDAGTHNASSQLRADRLSLQLAEEFTSVLPSDTAYENLTRAQVIEAFGTLSNAAETIPEATQYQLDLQEKLTNLQVLRAPDMPTPELPSSPDSPKNPERRWFRSFQKWVIPVALTAVAGFGLFASRRKIATKLQALKDKHRASSEQKITRNIDTPLQPVPQIKFEPEPNQPFSFVTFDGDLYPDLETDYLSGGQAEDKLTPNQEDVLGIAAPNTVTNTSESTSSTPTVADPWTESAELVPVGESMPEKILSPEQREQIRVDVENIRKALLIVAKTPTKKAYYLNNPQYMSPATYKIRCCNELGEEEDVGSAGSNLRSLQFDLHPNELTYFPDKNLLNHPQQILDGLLEHYPLYPDTASLRYVLPDPTLYESEEVHHEFTYQILDSLKGQYKLISRTTLNKEDEFVPTDIEPSKVYGGINYSANEKNINDKDPGEAHPVSDYRHYTLLQANSKQGLVLRNIHTQEVTRLKITDLESSWILYPQGELEELLHRRFYKGLQDNSDYVEFSVHLKQLHTNQNSPEVRRVQQHLQRLQEKSGLPLYDYYREHFVEKLGNHPFDEYLRVLAKNHYEATYEPNNRGVDQRTLQCCIFQIVSCFLDTEYERSSYEIHVKLTLEYTIAAIDVFRELYRPRI